MPEAKTCQNCKQNFTIADEDFEFYQKISVPPPTWCPECRMIRRFIWRNERVWYKRKCDATGKDMLSVIAPDKPYKVYLQDYWKSDAWDPMTYGKDYDFSKPFFEQFQGLLIDVPHPNLIQKNVVKSDYSNYSLNLKDCYYVASADGAEDSGYIFGSSQNIKSCYDIYQCTDVEFCYGTVDCIKNGNLFFSQNCVGCADSFFLYDCRNCTNCFGCVGLRGKTYHVFNEPYPRAEYEKKIQEFFPLDEEHLSAIQKRFEQMKLQLPRKYASILNSVHVIGDDIYDARDCYACFFVRKNVENVKYGFRVLLNTKDSYDVYVGWDGSELLYEVVSVSGQNVRCSTLIWGGFNIEYSYDCFDCNNIFGCVSLRNKSYCIFNKQYSKEEYEQLVPKIIQQMKDMPYIDAKGRTYRYGEFFPAELSPFSYNETVAQEYFPIQKQDAEKMGYAWRPPEGKIHVATLKADALPANIEDVEDSLLNETIECAHRGECQERCTLAFRVVSQEFEFLRKFHLPLPRLCPICRHAERLRLKNPLKLWHRQCMCDYKVYKNSGQHSHHLEGRCPNEFETSYAPDRKEIVYCESCYNSEVV